MLYFDNQCYNESVWNKQVYIQNILLLLVFDGQNSVLFYMIDKVISGITFLSLQSTE